MSISKLIEAVENYRDFREKAKAASFAVFALRKNDEPEFVVKKATRLRNTVMRRFVKASSELDQLRAEFGLTA